MAEADKRASSVAADHLLRDLAVWGLGSVMLGVLLGRYLKHVSNAYPLVEPDSAPAPQVKTGRSGRSL
ncbi:hypothetical protein LMIY3S_01811 [Labrys miyagiensis]